MRGAVRAAVLEFTARLEGSLPFMYLDFHHKGDGTLDPLVTTGRGNLIDPLGAALRLPWRLKASGALATQVQIASEWHAIKAMTELAHMGGGTFASVTTLKLAQIDVDALDFARVDSDERTLKARSPFASFDLWCADAQLGPLQIAQDRHRPAKLTLCRADVGDGFGMGRVIAMTHIDAESIGTGAQQLLDHFGRAAGRA